jgi:hypothetical protein
MFINDTIMENMNNVPPMRPLEGELVMLLQERETFLNLQTLPSVE